MAWNMYRPTFDDDRERARAKLRAGRKDEVGGLTMRRYGLCACGEDGKHACEMVYPRCDACELKAVREHFKLASEAFTRVAHAINPHEDRCLEWGAYADVLVDEVKKLQARHEPGDACVKELERRLDEATRPKELELVQLDPKIVAEHAKAHDELCRMYGVGPVRRDDHAEHLRVHEKLFDPNADVAEITFRTRSSLAPWRRLEIARQLVEDEIIKKPSDYFALLNEQLGDGRRLIEESGPGLAARYPDATPAAKPAQEPITCDLGADWED